MVYIFCKIDQKFEISRVKVAIGQSACVNFFATPFMLFLNDFSVFDTNANIIMVLNMMH